MDEAEILDDCLDRLRTGESVAQCLRRYPEHAAELAPMLVAAARLASLHEARLTLADKQHAKHMLRLALRQRAVENQSGKAPPSTFLAGPAWLARARGFAVASACAVMACLVWMATAVAASGPGEVPYGVRIWFERVPALLQTGGEERSSSELAIAERRMADVQAYFDRSGKVDTRAVEALLASDEAAVQSVEHLPPNARDRVTATVTRHAQILTALSEKVPAAPAAAALKQAADSARAFGQTGPALPVLEATKEAAPGQTALPAQAETDPPAAEVIEAPAGSGKAVTRAPTLQATSTDEFRPSATPPRLTPATRGPSQRTPTPGSAQATARPPAPTHTPKPPATGRPASPPTEAPPGQQHEDKPAAPTAKPDKGPKGLPNSLMPQSSEQSRGGLQHNSPPPGLRR